MAPLTARDLNGKRKRDRMADEDSDKNKVTKRGEEENMCPNGSTEKTTPVRKARGQAKGAQKLFTSKGDATKMKGTGKENDNAVVCCPNVKSMTSHYYLTGM